MRVGRRRLAQKPYGMDVYKLSVFFVPRFTSSLAHKDLFLGNGNNRGPIQPRSRLFALKKKLPCELRNFDEAALVFMAFAAGDAAEALRIVEVWFL